MCEYQTKAISIDESRSLNCLRVLNLITTKSVKNKLADLIIASSLLVILTSVEQVQIQVFELTKL